MAGIITISPGHDASYPWRQIGTAAEAGHAGDAGAGYYLSPAEKGGEPPGRWHGGGIAELGFRDGQIIDRAVFEPLYGQFLDPRDRTGQTRLGRAPQRFRSAEDIYAALAALEPEATAERRAELLIEAKTQVRTPVMYFDATFSVSKSITLLHASAMANAAKVASEGDLAAVAYWEEAAAEVWASIEAGNRAALAYLQREAGYTRSGYHGRAANGVRTGRWEDAHGFIVGSFEQHTSRDGDPQLHIHNLILNRVMRERDGAWRTLDSQALFEHRGAASAIATLVAESALSRRFGVGWVRRADGHGREVRGVSRELMSEFSSRRQTITVLTGRLAEKFEARHGYAPDARAVGKLRQWANHQSRRAKPGEPLDLDAAVRQWVEQARAGEAGALEPVMPGVTSRRGHGDSAPAGVRPLWELTEEQVQEVMSLALARAQDAAPTWRRADLIRHLGELLPDDAVCRDDRAATTLLDQLADQVLAGGAGEPVLRLEAPEWPAVPSSLRRADGRSVFRPHGGTRYATIAQLTMEERLTAQALAPGAPRLTPELAAQLLGADQAQLEAQLHEAAQTQAAEAQPAGSGLRLDQAAAAFAALTSDRRAEVIVGPAGSGKTRTAAQIAQTWRDAGMGEVIGLATSQTARNVLVRAGVDRSFNTARFLGHSRRRREAAAVVPVRPGSLLIVDEASMISMADLSAVMRVAADRNCRVLITGDHAQLTAVEGGGAMMMLAREMGYVQLAEPVRFTQQWERDASLRLRLGDVSVLAEYDQQGRLRGGPSEEAVDLACRAWVADHLAGKDTLLLARTGEQARELARRVRDDLVHYGVVETGPVVRLQEGAVASRGDLIVARKNHRPVIAGEPGRWLTNHDVLRIEEVGGRSVAVRRLLGRDADSGEPAWTEPFELPETYLSSYCDLAYAATAHAAEGRTADTAHTLVDGLGARQELYVGMTRGRESNYAYAVTGYPRAADIREGSRPAPELDRARRVMLERAGLPADQDLADTEGGAPSRDPVSVLAEVLQRDGAEMSATETLRQELANADHLGVLGSIWYDLTRSAQVVRFERALRESLPAGDAEPALSDSACTWLWRSLREAEAAGLDGTGVLREAISSRPMDGARDIARVVDARVRRMLRHIVPSVGGSWAERVPEMGDPEIGRFMDDLAAAMDDRVARIGEHAFETKPAWATQALGEVPDTPAEQANWRERAAKIGAYRELYGYQAPTDAIGPEPGKTSPEARADWHTAFGALGRVDGIDVRRFTDNQLRDRRDRYERETAWAPPYVGEELRLARAQRRVAWENTIRAEHEARAATSAEVAERHVALAGMWRAMEVKATRVGELLAEVHETRRQWEAFTEPTRRIAVAADLELRRRHPGVAVKPLRSAEPAGLTAVPARNDGVPQSSEEVAVQLTLDGAEHLPATVAEPGGDTGTARSKEVHGQQALGLTPDTVHEEIPQQVTRIRENARLAQERIDEFSGVEQFAEHDDSLYLGPGWGELLRRERDAVLQPPQPDIVPASAVLRRAQEREAGREPEPA